METLQIAIAKAIQGELTTTTQAHGELRLVRDTSVGNRTLGLTLRNWRWNWWKVTLELGFATTTLAVVELCAVRSRSTKSAPLARNAEALIHRNDRRSDGYELTWRWRPSQ
jgi:hypothetical protein